MDITFNKARLKIPDSRDKRMLFVTYCGRFCLGWLIKNKFVDCATSIQYTPNTVMMWIYESDLLPKDFKEEQIECGWNAFD
jgi:hypothetical protein